VIDSFHHVTGVRPSTWDFREFDSKRDGFHGLVENHYRYYQFYSNTFVAVAVLGCSRLILKGGVSAKDFWAIVGLVLLEAVLLAGSRDALVKYYRRAERLLGTVESQKDGGDFYDQWLPPENQGGATVSGDKNEVRGEVREREGAK
jgi:hypothetical protein